jgi:hypothetical protein
MTDTTVSHSHGLFYLLIMHSPTLSLRMSSRLRGAELNEEACDERRAN